MAEYRYVGSNHRDWGRTSYTRASGRSDEIRGQLQGMCKLVRC